MTNLNNAIILYDLMLAHCLVQVIERSLDDTEAEVLYESDDCGPRMVLRVTHLENIAVKDTRDHPARKKRISVRVKPDIDH